MPIEVPSGPENIVGRVESPINPDLLNIPSYSDELRDQEPSLGPSIIGRTELPTDRVVVHNPELDAQVRLQATRSLEEAAKIKQLEGQYGVPLDITGKSSEYAIKQYEAIERDGLKAISPFTNFYAINEQNYNLVREDLYELSVGEHITRKTGAFVGYGVESVGMTLSGLAELTSIGRKKAIEAYTDGLEIINPDLADEVRANYEEFGKAVPWWLDPVTILDAPGESLKTVGHWAKPIEPSILEEIIGATGQLSSQIAIYMMLGGGAVAIGGLGQGADVTSDKLEDSFTGDNVPEWHDVATILGGTVTGLTERFGIDLLFKHIPNVYKNRIARVLLSAGSEASQEILEEVGQNLVILGFDHTREIPTDLVHSGIVGAGAGAVLGALLPGRQGGKATSPKGKDQKLLQQPPRQLTGPSSTKSAAIAKTMLDKSNEIFSQTKLAKASPETSQEHRIGVVQNSGIKEVYVPLVEFMKRADPQTKLLMSESVTEAINSQATDIKISATDFAKHIFGKDNFKKLADHISYNAPGKSYFEKVQGIVENVNEVKEYIETIDVGEEISEQAQALKNRAGRFIDEITGATQKPATVQAKEVAPGVYERRTEAAQSVNPKQAEEGDTVDPVYQVLQNTPDRVVELVDAAVDAVKSKKVIEEGEIREGRIRDIDQRKSSIAREVTQIEENINQRLSTGKPTKRLENRLTKIQEEDKVLTREKGGLKARNPIFQNQGEKAFRNKVKDEKPVDIKAKRLRQLNVKATESSERAVRQAFRKAATTTKKEVKEVQKGLRQFINDSGLSKENKAKYIGSIERVQTIEQLQKELPKIQERILKDIDRQRRAQLKGSLQKTIKSGLSSQTSPELNDILTEANEAFKITKKAAIEQLETGTLSDNPLVNAIVALKAGSREADTGFLEQVLIDTDELVKTGKAVGKSNILAKAQRIATLRKRVLEAIDPTDTDLVVRERRIIQHVSNAQFSSGDISLGRDGMIHFSEYPLNPIEEQEFKGSSIFSLSDQSRVKLTNANFKYFYSLPQEYDTDTLPLVRDLGEWYPLDILAELKENGIVESNQFDNWIIEKIPNPNNLTRDKHLIDIGFKMFEYDSYSQSIITSFMRDQGIRALRYVNHAEPGRGYSIAVIDPSILKPLAGPIERKPGQKYFRVDDLSGTIHAGQVSASIQKGLQDLGRRVVGPGFTLRGGTNNTATPALRLATIVLEASDAKAALGHEAMHILRHNNAFTNEEWSTLTKQAEEKWLAEYKIPELYKDLDREGQIEEAIAEAYGQWTNGRRFTTEANTIFEKLQQFFNQAVSMLNGKGYKSAEDIFADIDRGKYALTPTESINLPPNQEFIGSGEGPPIDGPGGPTAGRSPNRRLDPNEEKAENFIGTTWLGWNGVWRTKLQYVFEDSNAERVKQIIEDLGLFEQSRVYDQNFRKQTESFTDRVRNKLGDESEKDLLRQWQKDNEERVFLGTFTMADGQSKELSFTKSELRKRYMEMQNPDLREHIFSEDGEGFTSAVEEAIDQNLNEFDRIMVETQLEFYSDYYDRINDVYRNIYGVNLPRVENYIPVKREFGDGSTSSTFLEGVRYYGGPTPTALKKRQGGNQKLKVQSDMSVMQSHLLEMEYFIAYAEKVRELNQVFRGNNNEVVNRISDKHGRKVAQTIQNDLNYFEKKGDTQSIVGESWLFQMARNFGFAQLAAKPQIGLKQVASFAAFAETVNTREFINGMVEFARNPRGALELLNRSQFFRDRGMNLDNDFQDLRSDALSGKLLNFMGRNPRFTRIMMLPIRVGDKAAIALGGYAHIHAKLKAGATEAEALDSFARLANRTQQSSDPDQTTELQRTSGLARVLVQFMTSANAIARAEIEAVLEFRKGRLEGSELAKRLMVYHLVIPNLIQFIANGFSFDEEDQLKASILGSFNGLLLIGDALEYGARALVGSEHPFDIEGRHPLEFANSLIRLLNQDEWDLSFSDIIDGSKAIERAAEFGGAVTGIPLETLYNSTRGLLKSPSIEGSALMLGYSPYTADRIGTEEPSL